MAVSLKHPRHLSKRASPILHVTQTESDRNAIKGSIGEWQLLLQRKRQISCASSKIDNFVRPPTCDRVGSTLSPIKIDPAAKRVISQIVPSGNVAKHLPNSCGLCCGTGFCHLKVDKRSTQDSMIVHFLFTTWM